MRNDQFPLLAMLEKYDLDLSSTLNNEKIKQNIRGKLILDTRQRATAERKFWEKRNKQGRTWTCPVHCPERTFRPQNRGAQTEPGSDIAELRRQNLEFGEDKAAKIFRAKYRKKERGVLERERRVSHIKLGIICVQAEWKDLLIHGALDRLLRKGQQEEEC